MTSTVPFVSNGAALNGNGNGNGFSPRDAKVLNPIVSARIRERLQEAGVSFVANDNVSAYIEPGEMAELEIEVADKVRELLRSLVIDIDNDHNTHETAERVARLFTSPRPNHGQLLDRHQAGVTGDRTLQVHPCC